MHDYDTRDIQKPCFYEGHGMRVRVITSGEPQRLATGLAEGESNLESVVELRNDKYSLQP